MVSKTRMIDLVRAFDWPAVEAGLAESPDLLGFRDERGRNWLHLCCISSVEGGKRDPAASIKTADVLLAHGLGIDDPAFTEGDWKATPLWFAIGRGRNLALAEHLLTLGCNPNYCLFAASWNHDLAAIRLLVRHGAEVDEHTDEDDGGTPFLGAIKWSFFDAAEELLKLGADVNTKDGKGMTALHLMLKKGSDKRHFSMLIAHGARGDIPGPNGQTAAEIMRRKKDPDFRRMAAALL